MFLAERFRPSPRFPFSLNDFDRVMSREFQLESAPIESVLPDFRSQRGFKVYPFHDAIRSAVMVCLARYGICSPKE